jgi:hypothetical protein
MAENIPIGNNLSVNSALPRCSLRKMTLFVSLEHRTRSSGIERQDGRSGATSVSLIVGGTRHAPGACYALRAYFRIRPTRLSCTTSIDVRMSSLRPADSKFVLPDHRDTGERVPVRRPRASLAPLSDWGEGSRASDSFLKAYLLIWSFGCIFCHPIDMFIGPPFVRRDRE